MPVGTSLARGYEAGRRTATNPFAAILKAYNEAYARRREEDARRDREHRELRNELIALGAQKEAELALEREKQRGRLRLEEIRGERRRRFPMPKVPTPSRGFKTTAVVEGQPVPVKPYFAGGRLIPRGTRPGQKPIPFIERLMPGTQTAAAKSNINTQKVLASIEQQTDPVKALNQVVANRAAYEAKGVDVESIMEYYGWR